MVLASRSGVKINKLSVSPAVALDPIDIGTDHLLSHQLGNLTKECELRPTHVFRLLWSLFVGSFERSLGLVRRGLRGLLFLDRLKLGSGRVGTGLNVSGIEIEHGTVSPTITLDAINVDVDQLFE